MIYRHPHEADRSKRMADLWGAGDRSSADARTTEYGADHARLRA